jgi:Lsr2
MRIITKSIVCDRDHAEEVPAVTTRTLTVDGSSWQIDLCGPCNAAGNKALELVLRYARTVSPARDIQTRPRRTRQRRERDAAIRAWWAANPDAVPHKFTRRGRLPMIVISTHRATQQAAAA